NIAPEEIEAVLLQHPSIADVAVVGVDDQVWGQRPMAALVLRPGCEVPSTDELTALCRAQLQRFKAPVGYTWRTSLPRDPLGKLRRREVKARLLTPQAQPGQPLAKGLGDRALFSGLEVHADMHQGDAGTLNTIHARDPISASHGRGADFLHLQTDVETLAESDRVHVVGFGMHEGHVPNASLEGVFERAEHRDDEFLKRGVTVIEEASEKHDSRAVDVAEV